jgi:hypothetical protein
VAKNDSCTYSGSCKCTAGLGGSMCIPCDTARYRFEHCGQHENGCHLECPR